MSHWLSCSEIYFTTIIFYYVGQTPPDVQWRKRKPNYQEHQESSFFFIYLTFRIALLFCFWENVLFTFYVLATTVLFFPVGKRSNNRSQMFCKIDALKNLAIFTGKHLRWRFFLINFIKKRHRHRSFL